MFIDPHRPESQWHRVFGAQGDVARRVLDLLLTDGPMPRTRLSDRLGVPTGSVTKAVRTLTQAGLAEVGPAVVSGTVGRPLRPVAARPDELSAIGCKVVPGRVLGCRVNLLGDVQARVETGIPDTTAEGIREGCLTAAGMLDADRPVVGMGVGVGGTIAGDRRTLVRSRILDAAPGEDIASGIGERLGVPVHVENDLRCLVEMERRIGVGRHAGSFIVVTLGQGLGTCIVDHGHMITGASGDAGLNQQVMSTIDRAGAVRPGGLVLTTPAILQQAAQRGLPPDADDLIGRADAGEERALEVAEWLADRVVPLLASMVSLADPELILLGGELSPLLRPVADDLAARLGALVAPYHRHLPIHIADSEFGDWARGAAIMALEELLRA